jgi:hypothetical protein
MLDFIWTDKRVKYLSCKKQELNTRLFGGGCISFFPSWPLRSLRRGFFLGNHNIRRINLCQIAQPFLKYENFS